MRFLRPSPVAQEPPLRAATGSENRSVLKSVQTKNQNRQCSHKALLHRMVFCACSCASC